MLDLEVEGLGALRWRSSWGEPHLGAGLGLGEGNWVPGSARLGRFHLLLSAAGTVVTCHQLLLSSMAVSCSGSHCRDATTALLLQRGSAELPPHFQPQNPPQHPARGAEQLLPWAVCATRLPSPSVGALAGRVAVGDREGRHRHRSWDMCPRTGAALGSAAGQLPGPEALR